MPRRRKWRSSAHTRKPVSAPQKPAATTHSVFGTILGLSHARAGLWGRCGTALARGHPNRGRSQRWILHRQLQPLPPHPDRPMQRAPHLLRQAPGAPGPTRPPKQEKQAPISLSWAATRAGGRIAEAAVASTTAKAAQTAVSPEKYPGSIHRASLPTPKLIISSPRMKPTACLDPRSARRRAKRGARRGAITAHRL